MYLDRRKSAELINNHFVGNLQRVLNLFANNHRSCHAGGCDSGAAAKGLELRVCNHIVLINLDLNLHHISTDRTAIDARSVCVFHFTNIFGI